VAERLRPARLASQRTARQLSPTSADPRASAQGSAHAPQSGPHPRLRTRRSPTFGNQIFEARRIGSHLARHTRSLKSSNAVIGARMCRPFRHRSRCRSIAAPQRQAHLTAAPGRWPCCAEPRASGGSWAPDRSVSSQPWRGRSTKPRRQGECSSCVLCEGRGLATGARRGSWPRARPLHYPVRLSVSTSRPLGNAVFPRLSAPEPRDCARQCLVPAPEARSCKPNHLVRQAGNRARARRRSTA